MSILIGIAVLFGIMFAMFSGAASGGISPHRTPRITLRARRDTSHPIGRVELLIDGENFEPDSRMRFIAWYLPDGSGHHHREPVESATPFQLRGSYFEDVAFEPAIALVNFAGDGQPHDVKVIATDAHGNAAEAWISGREFYLKKKTGVAA